MSHITIVYPRWPKIPEQTEFHLPPHGPVCLAAEIPSDYEVSFIDENVDRLDLDRETDVVLLSMMLSCQVPRGLEIAAAYRRKGIKVIAGGISTMLHSEEV
ncbi:MAG: radical SAM protein, partial [Desulfurivibrionaceae bacterium]